MNSKIKSSFKNPFSEARMPATKEKILEKLHKLVNPGPKQKIAIKESMDIDLGRDIRVLIRAIQKNGDLDTKRWLDGFYYIKDPLVRAFFIHALFAILERQEELDDIQRQKFKDAGGKPGERFAIVTENHESISAMTPVENPDYELTGEELKEQEQLRRLHEMTVYHPPYE